jgi:hypothetical protein
MPAVALEKVTSGQAAAGEQPTVTLVYAVQGAADHDEALAALADEAPATIGALVRKTWRVEPEEADGWWSGTVEYGSPGAASKETGESEFQFDTSGGGSVRLYQALEHIHDYAPEGETAPNHQGAINVVRDSNGLRVEGVDVGPPGDALAFSVTRYQETVDLGTLYALSHCVNADAWSLDVDGVSGAFGPREVLFLGASGSKRGRGDWSVRYSFAAIPSATLSIGGISGIEKAGMDYLWIEYADTTSDAANCLVKKPIAAHVERVFRTGDLAALGIPAPEA